MSRQVNFQDHDISVLIEETVEDLALSGNAVTKPGRKMRDIIKVIFIFWSYTPVYMWSIENNLCY